LHSRQLTRSASRHWLTGLLGDSRTALHLHASFCLLHGQLLVLRHLLLLLLLLSHWSQRWLLSCHLLLPLLLLMRV